MVILDRLAKETGRDYAMRVIRHNIVTLQLQPGEMVSENEICAQLGLSRTPVREALMELSKVNIVEILPQKGSRVSLIDYNLIEESRLMRLLLEVSIVENLCQTELTETQKAAMAENIELQKFYVNNEMNQRFFHLDDEFHALLFQFDNRLLSYQMAKSFGVHFDRVRSLSMGKELQHDETLVEQHIAIYQAILNHDSEGAKNALTDHLTGYKVDSQAIRQKYPDFITN